MTKFPLVKFFKFADILRDLCLLPYARGATKKQLYARCAYTEQPTADRRNIEVITKKSIGKLSLTSVLRFCRFLTGHQTLYNNILRKRKVNDPEYPGYYWNHIKRRMMKCIDEYKGIKIGATKSLEMKKKLEQDLVELFYLWAVNNKGLKYIKTDVMYI